MSERDTAVVEPGVTARELQHRYAAEHALDQADAQRLMQLRDKALDVELSREEMLERLVLERAREDREPRLRRMQIEAASALDELNIQQVLAVWDDLIADKQAAYTRVYEAMGVLRDAWKSVFEVHLRQEQEWATLPKAGSSLSTFPSGSELAGNLTSRMPFGWQGILNATYPEEPWHINWALVWDVDPGLKPLEATSIGRINEQARLYRAQMAQQADIALDDDGGGC
jgi:hypothetical protein